VRRLGIWVAVLMLVPAALTLPVFGQSSAATPTAQAPAAGSAATQSTDKTADRRAKRAAAKQAASADAAPAGVRDQPDYDAIYKLKDEGFNRSQVMEIESYLTDVYGPRLTNSPNIKAAAEWTTKKMGDWQLANVKTEPWEPFGRGWSNEKFFAEMVGPRPFILIGYPKAWTPGTNGPVTAEVVYAAITKEEDLAKYKGQLKGKLVITQVPDPVLPHFEADAKRYTDAELADLANFQITGGGDKERDARIAQFRAQRDLQNKIMKFLLDEGCDLRITEGDGEGRRLAMRNFKGEAWAGERSDREQKPAGLEGFRKNFRHAIQSAILDAFGRAHNELPDAKVRADAEDGRAQKLRGDDGNHNVGGGDSRAV